MSKADRILGYFPAFYRATQPGKLLRQVVEALAAPIEEADTVLFRIQRAHRLRVAEHVEDILRLAATLNLTPFHFEDLLAGSGLPYEERLARMRDRVWRVAHVHLVGLGTPWAVLEAAATFLDVRMVPKRTGTPLIRHLDAAGFSHVATVEFNHAEDAPRERLELHENPLLRRTVAPAGRWHLDRWTIDNRNVEPSPVTLSIQGVGERTVMPTIFCPDIGAGVVFNGIVPDGKTLRIDARDGARIDGTLVDAWVTSYTGGIFDWGRAESATVVVEQGSTAAPYDGDDETFAATYTRKRTVPGARVGASQWYFGVAQGTFDGSAFDYAVYQTPAEPVGVYDQDNTFDHVVFDYPPSATVGMAWDERLLCVFKLLLPAYMPPPAVPEGAPPAEPNINYVGRIGSIMGRFKAAGVRAYVDTARDAWIVGESILRDGAAADGPGVAFHTTRLRDPTADLYVDADAV
jgi:hypothetical protein